MRTLSVRLAHGYGRLDPAEPRRVPEFLAFARHQLDAETDAEDRAPLFDHELVEQLDQPELAEDCSFRRRNAPTPGKISPSSLPDRASSDVAGIRPIEPFERGADRSEIAEPVVDDATVGDLSLRRVPEHPAVADPSSRSRGCDAGRRSLHERVRSRSRYRAPRRSARSRTLVVLARQIEPLFARHVSVLNQPAGVAHRASEAELDELPM